MEDGPHESRTFFRAPVCGLGQTVTAKDGSCSIGQLTPGRYNVNAFLTGDLEQAWTSVAFDRTEAKTGETKSGLDIKLIKGGLIIGTVKFSDGKPIEGAYVGVYGPARPRSGAWVQTAIADAEGHYILRVPPGQNHVYVAGVPNMNRLIQDMRNVTVEEGKEIRVDLSISR
ncbi:MAG: carboxypeptidase regulatory-like domain-containing protein [Armatimonadetes bacterium]|nr:carboxypeptidase regulatory-like domain-containing protein [Armatimonadota bacterium]